MMELEPARISDDEIEKIKNLEQEMGKVLLAVEKPRRIANLTESQLQALKKAEESLGCVVVAYSS